MEDFVIYYIAFRLKQLGFNEKCNHTYDPNGNLCENTEDDYNISPYHDFNNETYGVPIGHISAPTIHQALKWLRLTKNIVIWPYSPTFPVEDVCKNWQYELWVNAEDKTPKAEPVFKSPENAIMAGLLYAINTLF